MATATKPNHHLDATEEQVTQLNEHLVEAGKRAGNLYLNSYDKFVESATSFQQKLGEQSKNDAVMSVVATQVELTRQFASAYTSAARRLIAY
ncbi:MAG: hypothetical protein M3022_17675 [Actinomycetota bacterium]|nr:hypothetical protein [Actinomycetota bacterium]